MKEASGEANMTVITIILIGIVLAIATPIISGLVGGSAEKACKQDGGTWNANETWIGGDGKTHTGKCNYN